MIPKEAVESAAKVLHDGGEQSWLAWDDITPFGQDAYRSQAQRILETAAPHLRADAWDEGLTAGHHDRRLNANPYRSQP